MFGLTEHAHDVFSHQLVDIRRRVPSVEHFLGDARVCRDIFKLLRHTVDAVVVRADPYMIDATLFDEVFDMIDDLIDIARRHRIVAFPLRERCVSFRLSAKLFFELFDCWTPNE